MEIVGTGFSPVRIEVSIEPIVSGVAVLSVGKIWLIPEEMEVMLTLGETSGVIILVSWRVLPDVMLSIEAVGEIFGLEEVTVIQLVTTTGGLQSRL